MQLFAVKLVVAVVMIVLITLIRVIAHKIRNSGSKAQGQSPLPPLPPKAALTKPVLRGISGVYQGADVPFDGKPIVLGRDPGAANLVFPSETRGISSRHCVVKFENSRFYVEDCWSTNGTFLASGKAVAPGKSVPLKPGARFYLGDQSNMFEVTMIA